MAKYTAIWQVKDVSERDWVNEILGPHISEHIVDHQHEVVLDNCILIDSYVYCFDPAYYARFAGKNAFLLHLSDECYQGGDYAVYKHFRGVFRNYWSDVFNPEMVLTLPLGYKNGTQHSGAVSAASSRRFVWTLLGECNKSSRPDAVRALSPIEPHFCYPTDQVPGLIVPAARAPLGTKEYQEVLLNSMFVPCPMGNSNIESFRTFEALEAGAIPVVERRLTLDYYRKLLGSDFPGLVVRNWSEARLKIARLLEHPSEMDALQRQCMEWWAAHKDSCSTQMGALLERRSGSHSPVVDPLRARRVRIPLWQELELIRHHSFRALLRRAGRQFRRLMGQGRWRVAYRQGNGPAESLPTESLKENT